MIDCYLCHIRVPIVFAHAILVIVMNDKIQFFGGEAVVVGQERIYGIDKRLGVAHTIFFQLDEKLIFIGSCSYSCISGTPSGMGFDTLL